MIAQYRNPNALGSAMQWNTASGLWSNELAGLGAYPEDAYFDKDRPSWLPYWLDTPTESERKYNAANLIQATVNAAGTAAGTVVGAGVSYAANGVATAAQNTFDASNLSMGGYMVLGGVALLALLLVTRK